MRNDVTFGTSVDKITQLLSIIFSTLKNNGVEPIFVIDPPKTNYTTGKILDYSNGFKPIYKAALEVAKINKATIIDCWKYFEKKHLMGESLIPYMNDGTHPNELGYELISDLIFKALISQDKNIIKGEHKLIAVYDAWNTSQKTTTFTGITTASTARKQELEEVTHEAYNLSNGESIEFYNNGLCGGVIITAIQKPNSGSLSATYNSEKLELVINTSNSFIREFSFYSKFSTTFSAYHKKGKLKLTSTGNTAISGITFINKNN